MKKPRRLRSCCLLAEERLNKPFDKLKANGTRPILSVVSLWSHERHRLVRITIETPLRVDRDRTDTISHADLVELPYTIEV